MPVNNQVKLDIGGTIFKTSKSTLTKFDGMFKTMMETDVPVVLDDSGSIFIDRSPKHFEKILNYMRDGEVGLPSSKEEIEEIRREADYYLLTGLVELCTVAQPLEKSKTRLLSTKCEKIAKAFHSSTKKGIIIVYYRPGSDLKGAAKMAYVLQKCEKMFDVYFKCASYGNFGDSIDLDNWKFTFFKPIFGTEHHVLRDLDMFLIRPDIKAMRYETPWEKCEIRYISNFEDIVEALYSSTKEGVLIVRYHPDSGLEGAERMVYVQNRCERVFDVYFTNLGSDWINPDKWKFDFYEPNFETQRYALRDFDVFLRRRENCSE